MSDHVAYPDFNVKDLPLQVHGEGEQRDTTTCFIDAKNTIITCRDTNTDEHLETHLA